MYDGVITGTFAQTVTDQLIRMPAVQDSLKIILQGKPFTVVVP